MNLSAMAEQVHKQETVWIEGLLEHMDNVAGALRVHTAPLDTEWMKPALFGGLPKYNIDSQTIIASCTRYMALKGWWANSDPPYQFWETKAGYLWAMSWAAAGQARIESVPEYARRSGKKARSLYSKFTVDRVVVFNHGTGPKKLLMHVNFDEARALYPSGYEYAPF